jgi:hypothetical protein
MFAKISYRRLGRVDLDGIWHWREMQQSPKSYSLTKDNVLPCPEVARGRQGQMVWCHQPGDEWLVANPVEIPQSYNLVESCFSSAALECATPHSHAHLLGLPAELIDHIMSFLKESDLNPVHLPAASFAYIHNRSSKLLLLNIWAGYEKYSKPSDIQIHQTGQRHGIRATPLV